MLQLILVAWLTCFTSFALAVERNDAGKGQVLLFPFFTTENGWDTYINIILLSERYDEVLKVRVLDGVDGTVVNTFNVYTKVGENWRAALAEVAPNKPILRVAEGSCTVSGDGSFGGKGTDFPLHTSTGLIEIYRVGVYEFLGSGVLSALSCEELAQRWEEGGAWQVYALAGLREDESQPEIIGHFELINVAKGLSSEEPAIGLRDFLSVIPHTSPDSVSPSLADAEPIARLDTGDVVEPSSGEGIDAIALLLATREGSITNDVVVAANVAASTDWIVSFPLRGYKDYGAFHVEIDGVMRTCNANEFTDNSALYIEALYHEPWSSWGGGPAWRGPIDPLDPTPPARYSPFLCYAVNVLTFGENAPIFLTPDSNLHDSIVDGKSFEFPSDSFSVRYTFSDGRSDPSNNDGRPVVAYRVTSFVNGTLDGGNVLSNYMFMRPHIVE